MSIENRKWILKERPQGLVKDSDFELVTETLPPIQEGEILLENMYLSFDPTQRGWLNDVPGYLPPVQIGEVVRSGGMGRVIESKNPEYNVGDLTFGFVGWQSHCVTKAEEDDRFRVIPELLPIPTMLNVMGTTGITAYYGLIELGNPQPGETVLVSGAAGATGSVVVQIAKLKGCHVIGIAGGQEKCDWLKELGVDEVIDYKNSDVHEELPKIAKNGIDIYFENVGGAQLEAALPHIKPYGRIPICGMIAHYNDGDTLTPGPRNLMETIYKFVHLKGFVVSAFEDQREQFVQDMSGWLSSGQMKYHETIHEGIENAPAAFMGLFTGSNNGKMLVRLAED